MDETGGQAMRFVKMHGAGNDYVYVDCFAERQPDDPAALAPRIADRHRGVGGDGLVLVLPSTRAACTATMQPKRGVPSMCKVKLKRNWMC